MFAPSVRDSVTRMTPLRYRRRGVVAVQVGVMLTALMGMAALSIDVGALYNVKADLQRTVDAAALAAASQLSQNGEGIDPLDLARQAAKEYVEKNHVLGQAVTIDPNVDVVFGRAMYDGDSNSYTFTPTEDMPDAVRVIVRQTEGSPNGPIPLYFANVFGKSKTELIVKAAAVMVPRDIAIVADLSGSHSDDSELMNYKKTTINLYDVWDAFDGGIDDVGGGWNPEDLPPDWVDESGFAPQAAGPAWGYFKKMGYGTTELNSSYSVASDTGLVRLPKGSNWSNNTLKTWIKARGYNDAEVNALFSSSSDNSGGYPYRVAVALGLAEWNSGISGGYWSTIGIPPAQSGNGNTTVGSNETIWVEQFGDRTVSASASIWYNYINSYMTSGSTGMTSANSGFRYRYGVKTFMNYLLENRVSHSQTPELASAPHQPMEAVKQAVQVLTNLIDEMNTDDQLSLEIYGTTAKHEVDLTLDQFEVSDRLNEMQAGHYDSWTNMGGGIKEAIKELKSDRARPSARKIIFLLTDGYANVNANGGTNDINGGTAYSLAQAQQAVNEGMLIYCVSVGSNSNLALMDQIADMSTGIHLYAAGSIDEYSSQLKDIFAKLGGERPVELIE